MKGTRMSPISSQYANHCWRNSPRAAPSPPRPHRCPATPFRSATTSSSETPPWSATSTRAGGGWTTGTSARPPHGDLRAGQGALRPVAPRLHQSFAAADVVWHRMAGPACIRQPAGQGGPDRRRVRRTGCPVQPLPRGRRGREVAHVRHRWLHHPVSRMHHRCGTPLPGPSARPTVCVAGEERTTGGVVPTVAPPAAGTVRDTATPTATSAGRYAPAATPTRAAATGSSTGRAPSAISCCLRLTGQSTPGRDRPVYHGRRRPRRGHSRCFACS